jgi:FixJ family two-component response regulator
MPKMTGYELAEATMKLRSDLPIILTTGFSDAVSPERAKELGIREYLKKPVSTDVLVSAVRRILDNL